MGRQTDSTMTFDRFKGFLTPSVIGFWVFILSACGVFGLIAKLHEEDRVQILSELNDETEELAAMIRVNLKTRFLALERMADRWSIRGGTPRAEFLSDASAYYTDQPGYQAIQWIDADYVVRWIEPLNGNEQLLDLDLGEDSSRRARLDLIQFRGLPTLGQPIDLPQGGIAMPALFPVYREDRFDGFVNALFRVDDWLSKLLSIDHLRERVFVGSQSHSNSGLVADFANLHVSVLVGDKLVYDLPTIGEVEDHQGTQASFVFSDQSFTVKVKPAQSFLEDRSSDITTLGLIAGLLFSSIFGLTIYQLLEVREQRRLAERQSEIAKRAQANERQSNEHMLASLDSMRDGFAIWSRDDRLILANKRFVDYHQPIFEEFKIGGSFEQFIELTYDLQIYSDTGADKTGWINSIIDGRRNNQNFARESQFSDGRIARYTARRSKNGEIIATVTDITEDRLRELELSTAKDELERIAFFDPLTGLANRASCQRDLAGLTDPTNTDQQFAMIQIDLDNFKRVNDTLGHAAGDHLLRTLGERLTLLQDDFPGFKPYRWGGDEFIAIYQQFEDEALVDLCQEMTDLIAIPVTYETATLNPTVSLGVARYPQDASTLEALIIFSDLALYKTKELGRDGYQFFTSEMKERVDREAKIEADLRVGIEKGQLELFYQPQVELRTGKLTGLEALIRWNHPEMGLVSPGQFITISETSGLGSLIGRHVLDLAIGTVRQWSDAGLDFGRVAVNLSPAHLKRGNFLEDFTKTTQAHSVDPKFLAVEILESYLFNDPKSDIESTLDTLREMGVWVELDDFGTGFASLSHLSTLPVNGLKIDQSFIQQMTRDPKKCGIVSSLISMSKLMGLHVVCEGVETESQLQLLHQFGHCSAQGFYLERPMPKEKTQQWIMNWDADAFVQRIADAQSGANSISA